MHYANIFKCQNCGEEIEIDGAFDPGLCYCGGAFVKSGECYDQEFVDQERYEMEQDQEYEERHKGERG